MSKPIFNRSRPHGIVNAVAESELRRAKFVQDGAYFTADGVFLFMVADSPAPVAEPGAPEPQGVTSDTAGAAEMRAMIEEMRKVKAEADAALAALRAAQSAPPEPAPPEPGDEAYEDMHYTQLKALVEALEGEYTNKAEAIAFLRAKDAERAAAA